MSVGEKLVTLSARGGGLIIEVLCAYSKISPLPSLGHAPAEKGGGAYFREGTVYSIPCSYIPEEVGHAITSLMTFV